MKLDVINQSGKKLEAVSNLMPIERIANKIFVIRGKKVMLDRDLAKLYGVETRVLNQAVRRNIERFPEDFVLLLSRQEIKNLSQIVISSKIKHSPNVFAFTEQGVAMLSSVLRSKKAVHVNIQIMRAFIRLRDVLATHKGLARRIAEHDAKITFLFDKVGKIVKLLKKPHGKMKKIPGFRSDKS